MASGVRIPHHLNIHDGMHKLLFVLAALLQESGRCPFFPTFYFLRCLVIKEIA